MMIKYSLSIVSMVILCCLATKDIAEQSSKNDISNEKYFNYLRLPDGLCHNCSTYKCTNHTSNLGGSEWCIMLFEDAIDHCNSDKNCGGYTMTTAEWFHKKYDKNGQVAVHLNNNDKISINCSFSEWSSYEKQEDTRSTPITYGKTTCENRFESLKFKKKIISFFYIDSNKVENNNNNYVFVSNSNAINDIKPYLCKNHENNLDNKDINCILSISDGIQYCNSDDECEGFIINTDENWQKKYSNNGMQSVQLYGKGATYTPDPIWRSFKKQS